jgi:predicted helicase
VSAGYNERRGADLMKIIESIEQQGAFRLWDDIGKEVTELFFDYDILRIDRRQRRISG